jgi:hypothetical protein
MRTTRRIVVIVAYAFTLATSYYKYLSPMLEPAIIEISWGKLKVTSCKILGKLWGGINTEDNLPVAPAQTFLHLYHGLL